MNTNYEREFRGMINENKTLQREGALNFLASIDREAACAIAMGIDNCLMDMELANEYYEYWLDNLVAATTVYLYGTLGDDELKRSISQFLDIASARTYLRARFILVQYHNG